jgi:hypothetical protein
MVKYEFSEQDLPHFDGWIVTLFLVHLLFVRHGRGYAGGSLLYFV